MMYIFLRVFAVPLVAVAIGFVLNLEGDHTAAEILGWGGLAILVICIVYQAFFVPFPSSSSDQTHDNGSAP